MEHFIDINYTQVEQPEAEVRIWVVCIPFELQGNRAATFSIEVHHAKADDNGSGKGEVEGYVIDGTRWGAKECTCARLEWLGRGGMQVVDSEQVYVGRRRLYPMLAAAMAEDMGGDAASSGQNLYVTKQNEGATDADISQPATTSNVDSHFIK